MASLKEALPQERRYASAPSFFSVHRESPALLLMVVFSPCGSSITSHFREGGGGGWEGWEGLWDGRGEGGGWVWLLICQI